MHCERVHLAGIIGEKEAHMPAEGEHNTGMPAEKVAETSAYQMLWAGRRMVETL